MSTFKSIRFCDKCGRSIAKGEIHHKHKNTHKCGTCEKATASYFNIVIVFMIIMCFIATIKVRNSSYNEIAYNSEQIKEANDYSKSLASKTSATFLEVGNWAKRTQNKLNSIDISHSKNYKFVKNMIDGYRTEIQQLVDEQKSFQQYVKKGELTNKEVIAALNGFDKRITSLNSNIKHLLHSTETLVNKVLKPTVGVAVHDTKRRELRGSGVLFKRVKSEINGKVSYTYYGISAYHVWGDIFAYIDRVKRKEHQNKLKPQLYIYVYEGLSNRSKYTLPAKWIHPSKAISGTLSSTRDFAMFKFKTVVYLEVAEVASNEEIKSAKKYNYPIITTGTSIGNVPSIWTGRISNPLLPGTTGTMVNAFVYFGQSGGPTFDAKTLKLIGINQRAFTHKKSPLSTVLFITTIDMYRTIFLAEVKKEYKGLLD